MKENGMNTLKMNFTVPADVAATLRAVVKPRNRSGFVTDAIVRRLQEVEQEHLRQILIEGYLSRREEDRKINAEWESISHEEGWG